MVDSGDVAAKRLVLEAAFAKGELNEAQKRLKILLTQTTAAKGAVAGVVVVTASAVAGSGAVLGRAVLIAAGAAVATGVADALVEFILSWMDLCLPWFHSDRAKGDGSEARVNASCDLWTMHGTIVIISAWRTQARRLPGAYMDAFKAQFELQNLPNQPALPSLADQSKGGRLEAAAKREAVEAASTEEEQQEFAERIVKTNIQIKLHLTLYGAMVGDVVGSLVANVQRLAAMPSAAGAQAAISKVVGWVVAVATVGATGAVAGARAAEFFDYPFRRFLGLAGEELVRGATHNWSSPHRTSAIPPRAYHYLYRCYHMPMHPTR